MDVFLDSAASFLLLRTWQRLNTIRVRWSLQVHCAVAVSIRWSYHVARQVLQVQFLSKLLVKLVDTRALFSTSLHIGRIQALRVRLGRL